MPVFLSRKFICPLCASQANIGFHSVLSRNARSWHVIKLSAPKSIAMLFARGRIFTILLVFPVLALVVAALWLSAMAVMENARFGRAIDQLINVVSAVHNFADHDPNFDSAANEDILQSLFRAGLMPAYSDSGDTRYYVTNPWEREITIVAPAPSQIRIETSVPNYICWRTSAFFLRDNLGLGVQMAEARADGQKLWRRFYDKKVSSAMNEDEVVSACNQSKSVTLALILPVR